MLAHTDQSLRELLHYPTYKFSLTNKFEAQIGNWHEFSLQKLEDKCTEFFDFIDTEIPNWELNKLKDFVYEKNVVRKDNYFNDQFKKMARDKKVHGDENPDVVTDEDRKQVAENFEEALKRTLESEQRMADSMTIVRVFGHCFYGKTKLNKDEKLADIYRRYNKKMVPFFGSELPQFDVSEYIFDTIPEKPNFEKGDDILDYYYNSISGLGIVISGATRYVREIVKFIHVLRAMGNKLPIQVMFRGDMLMRARQAIASAAYAKKEELLGSELSNQKILRQMIPDFSMSHEEIKRREFPIQEVTFVNMQRTLNKVTKFDFGSYNNKIVALFFSSFENVLLFDADTVPLMSPESFLKLKEFTESGAYFFRDRSLRDSNDWIETNYFAKLMPHETSKIDMAMGVKPVTAHTMGNQYMTGWRHHQEAGLVVFNKKKHFASMFVLFALALWGEPIKSLTWGDKELYWLAMSIAGDEDYTFNKYGAAGIGEVTKDKNLQRYNNTLASEVCSSHPGHVSSEGKLLWINSGFSYCKKNGYARDQLRFPYSQMGGRGALLKLYEEPLKIRLALVPPELPTLRPSHSPPDLTEELQVLVAIRKRKADVDQLDNVDQISTYNPQKGWIKSLCCQNYFYCAYNAVELFTLPGELDVSGQVFHYTPEETKEYDFLGTVWTSALKQVIEFKSTEPKIKPPPRKQVPEKVEEPKEEPEADVVNVANVVNVEKGKEETNAPKGIDNENKKGQKKNESGNEVPESKTSVENQAPLENKVPPENSDSMGSSEDTGLNGKSNVDNSNGNSAENKAPENKDSTVKDGSTKDSKDSEKDTRTESGKISSGIQLLSKSGLVISEPGWLRKQKESAKKLLGQKSKEEIYAVDNDNDKDTEAKPDSSQIYDKEPVVEFEKDKVMERPEHLRNNVNELIKQLTKKKKPLGNTD